MRVAILANTEASYVPTLAAGLQRMLGRIGVQSRVFHTALRWLIPANPVYRYPDQGSLSRRLKTLLKGSVAPPYLLQLAPYDVIVLVMHVPVAYMRQMRAEWIRALFPGKPLVLYDLVYLPAMDKWPRVLREGDPASGVAEGGHFGLERYDWYLVASAVGKTHLARGVRHPYSLVGMDLDDGTLFPEQDGEFVALLDFEQPGYEAERAVQVEALRRTGTPCVELSGHYPIQEIRRIYRRTALYFLAFHEAFGLPICELQACGAYVMTPYARWCPAHQQKEDPCEPGMGPLPPNFVVYDNDVDRLCAEIERLRSGCDPQAVVQAFRQAQPHYWHGNEAALREWVGMLERGEITARSHEGYRDWPVIDIWDAPEGGAP